MSSPIEIDQVQESGGIPGNPPVTTERRYGFSQIGCAAAVILIIAAGGVGAALIVGVTDAGILLAVILPVLGFATALASLFLWWQNKRAIRQRKAAADEWVSTTYAGQQAQATSRLSDTSRNSNSSGWFRRFSQRTSTQSTPPPGYQSVVGAS
ncbi:uncharacterized protein LOC105688412 isoform X1 [Athalia rosae]|uniref:uncharacterized protein LOC105688412 isoform X1 n=1 Tax=Athalia rosae TaxID=37344 RepID=UPI0020337F61|nr:uncharacterized protein LOC105688412 isoform X1 [Athalia rosae]XP_020709294.2 uncharacterized protein LOC105688412 isoform X1 [Athalia rosae]XP_048507238.1 uncharacterized protein LOC105688412 isoform X1 [Athalia rosae]